MKPWRIVLFLSAVLFSGWLGYTQNAPHRSAAAPEEPASTAHKGALRILLLLTNPEPGPEALPQSAWLLVYEPHVNPKAVHLVPLYPFAPGNEPGTWQPTAAIAAWDALETQPARISASLQPFVQALHLEPLDACLVLPLSRLQDYAAALDVSLPPFHQAPPPPSEDDPSAFMRAQADFLSAFHSAYQGASPAKRTFVRDDLLASLLPWQEEDPVSRALFRRLLENQAIQSQFPLLEETP